MINTFVPSAPELMKNKKALAGDYISLDIGSSNFRVLHTRLSAGGEEDLNDKFHVQYYDIPVQFRTGKAAEVSCCIFA